MSEQKHSPTPWRMAKAGAPVIVDGAGNGVADVWMNANEHELNGAHIVRCVNAWDSAEALRARLAELDRA